MTSKEVLEEIKDFKVVRLHESSLPEMTAPIAEHFKEQTSIIERDLDKLSQLEDIEKELGIDLITLFKAQKQGYVWELVFAGYDKNGKSTYKPKKQEHWFGIDFRAKALIGKWIGYDFKDYGKTWALTKEELEKNEPNNI